MKHRDYIGVDKLKKFGTETYNHYNMKLSGNTYISEVCEYIDGKWVIIDDKIFES